MKAEIFGVLVVIALLGPAQRALAINQPNIVLIYADDLGYGDLSCYGATAVTTPHLDQLAAGGIRFTDAHSTAATCTPSRFAMLTGRYAWRQQGTGIAAGNAPLIIDTEATTMASIAREAGLKSSVIGKWHLGLGNGQIDWNQKIAPGPLELGFDECFLVPATGDRVPTVYVENHHVVGLVPEDPLVVSYGKPIGDDPTGAERPDLLKQKPSHGHDNTIHNGVSRIGYMSGGEAARWVDEDMADTLTTRANDFIRRKAAAKESFFLFFSLHDIHVPRMPHQRFVGKTTMGPRGDVILQADWCVGEVMQQLESVGVADNTLVIFTSDNGPVVDDGYHDESVSKLGNHDPAGGLRGGKYSAFEAGTRVPMIARWPGTIAAGEVSGALVSQVDFCADIASILGVTLTPSQCVDSQEQVAALIGKDATGRRSLVEQSGCLALRWENWKYIEPSQGAAFAKTTSIELGNHATAQLYDLDKDPGERTNVIGDNAKLAKDLAGTLKWMRQNTP